MFNSKKQNLFNNSENVKTKKHLSNNNNSFINEAMKKSAETLSGNFALKYSTTGNDFLDQFGKVGDYLQSRSFDEISRDMDILWSQDIRKTLALTLYIRMITRKTLVSNFNKLSNNTKELQTTQIGAGLKHEGIMREIWIATKYPEIFWNNIHLFIAAGSWKDIFKMMSFDIQYHGFENKVLNFNKFVSLIKAGLENPKTVDLVKKYLPQIKARSKCKTVEAQANTIVAKYIAISFFKEQSKPYEIYRKLKSSGKAHEWQQLISKKLFNYIDFNKVPGKALMLMTSSKFLTNHNLEDEFINWLNKQPVAKFNGFVYELFKNIKYSSLLKKITVDKQFLNLIETAKQSMDSTETKYIVALDISGSMDSNVQGTNITAFEVAKSIALYTSYLLDGPFKNHFFTFASDTKLNEWKGTSPSYKFINFDTGPFGNTRIENIAKLLVAMKNKGINETEFPTGLICISDGEFNRTHEITNVENFKNILSTVFSDQYVKNFSIVLWDIPNDFYCKKRSPKFETYKDHKNVFYMSGFDPAGLTFLFKKDSKTKNTPKDAEELMEIALNQELMTYIKL